MKLAFTKPFHRLYQHLPPVIQRKVNRQLDRLVHHPEHPSLGLRKMVGQPQVWEARVDGQYRLTFEYQGETVILRKVGTHAIYKNP